jgi:hypothetical protein
MSWIKKETETGKALERQPDLRVVESEDVEFEAALKDFRNSIQAWSDAAMSRPRTVRTEIRHRSWRLAAGWALGCVLVAGGVSGGFLEQHHRQELVRIAAAQKAAAEQKQLEEQRAKANVSDEVLLAGVDSDVSRDVPNAMEPLAQLMVDDGTK